LQTTVQSRQQVAGVSGWRRAQSLQKLEADGFVLHVARDVVPPHGIHSLTPLGTEAVAHAMALTG